MIEIPPGLPPAGPSKSPEIPQGNYGYIAPNMSTVNVRVQSNKLVTSAATGKIEYKGGKFDSGRAYLINPQKGKLPPITIIEDGQTRVLTFETNRTEYLEAVQEVCNRCDLLSNSNIKPKEGSNSKVLKFVQDLLDSIGKATKG